MRNKQEKLPKISIITPSYNQGEYIEKTIQSVLSQNYPNLEYIVIDGGSNDKTVNILEKYKDKISYVSEKDEGQQYAINKGLKKSTGEIIAYLNSDDQYLPDALLHVADFFTKNKDINWVAGRCKIIDQNGKEIRNLITLWKDFWLKSAFLTNRQMLILLILNYICQPAVFWKKKLIKEIGFFDEKLDYSMDYDYWLKIMSRFRMGFIDSELSFFRIQKQSKTVKTFINQIEEGYKVVRRQTDSKSILFFHKFHDLLIRVIYKLINE